MRKFIVLLLLCALCLCAGTVTEAAEERIRIGIVGFDSKADGVSQSQADIVTDLFTRTLASSKTIAVYERERLAKVGEEIKLGMSGLVDMNTAIEVGRIAGVQYILIGSVTELSERMSGGAVPIFGLPVAVGGGGHEARATLDVRLIDTTTSETRLALSETGTSASTASAVSVMGLSFAEAEFGGLQARAIADAVNRLAHTIRGELGGESSHVLNVSGDEVIIDIGSSMGAKEGQLYLIYAEGKTILGMSGESLGRDKLPLAVIKVRDVETGHSTCAVASNCSLKLVRRGDKIEPITAAKAKGMKFVSTRPSASSETFDQIFGSGGPAPAPVPAPREEPKPVEEVVEVKPEVEEKPEEPQPATETSVTAELLKPAPAPAPSGPRVIPGFDHNKSTDSKVIQTYNLDMGKTNLLRIEHTKGINFLKSGRVKAAYELFVGETGKYEGHYLAMYWAGVAAHRLRKNDEALQWMNRALEINPQYEPAAEYKSKKLKK
ncbi:MAG: hypothetical protein GX181_04085 [Synergistaceae bacterium]|nr:hypothetical protein [Synergistaceae bacterium]